MNHRAKALLHAGPEGAGHRSILLRRIAESGAGFFWLSDGAGRFVQLHTDSMPGLPPMHSLSLIDWFGMAHPADALQCVPVLREALAQGTGYQLEYRLPLRDGSVRWMRSTGTPRRNACGECIGFIGSETDVTPARHAGGEPAANAAERRGETGPTHEELQRRAERFHSLTNLSADWYWEMDEQGLFTFISDGMHGLWGGQPSEVIGKSRGSFVRNQMQPGFQAYLEKFARREAFKNIRYAIDGELPGVLSHISISGEPIFEHGVFKGYRGIGRDVTGETLATEEIARLAQENKALIEHSIDIIAVLDPQGRYLQVSRAAADVLGYQPEEMVGRHYAGFVVPEDVARLEILKSRLIAEGSNTIHNFRHACRRRDGSIVHVSSSCRYAEDRQLFYVNTRDISSEYAAVAELDAARNRIATLLESIGDAFIALDPAWRLTYVNRKASKYIGASREALIGKVLWEAVPGLRHSHLMQESLQAAKSQRSSFFETFYEPANAWLDIRVHPHKEGLSVFFHDITAKRAAEQELRARDQRLRQVIALTPAGYSLTDAEGRFTEVNSAYCAITGYTQQELIGRNAFELLDIDPAIQATYMRDTANIARGRELSLRHKEGHTVHVLVNALAERDAQGQLVSLTAFVTDISDRKEAEALLEQLATHDTLTALPNRAMLHNRVQAMLDNHGERHAVAVMFIDLDRFKEINDSMGHERGDQLLREVAARLTRHMRPDDIVARLGGDEFVIAAHCASGNHAATTIAEKLLAALAEPVMLGGVEVFISASIGISMYPQDGTIKEVLFQNADIAMYRAKLDGRNRYRFFEAEMSIEAKNRLTLENFLRRALERDEFELHYQPRLHLATGTITGMEALIRWNHPELGRVPPSWFIPIAEERGFIEAIGAWVLEEACRQTRALSEEIGRPLRVSVNLSARQLRLPDFTQQVQAALRKSGLPGDMLELELTETALIEDMETSADMLTRLKALGIKLAVDDFGIGYSGLNYLRRFPFDSLKLDQSFIRQQGEAAKHFQFIQACVDLAHALNLSVVAEGVETADAMAFLRQVGCDEIQGFLFARPMPLQMLKEMLLREAAAARHGPCVADASSPEPAAPRRSCASRMA